jgi:hypothetical protein
MSSFLRRVLLSQLPLALLLFVLLPSFALAAPPDFFVGACNAGGGVTTMVAKFYAAFIGVLIAAGGFMLVTQRERSMSLVGGMVHHVTETAIIGVFIVAAPGIAAVIVSAIAGAACP